MNLSILIHTFNGYQHLWPGMTRGLEKNCRNIPTYWGTDVIPDQYRIDTVCGMQCSVLFSGGGEWSDRLKALLYQIPTDYVLYMQEDHWPTSPPPDLTEMMEIVTKNDLLRLQLSTINTFYRLKNYNGLHYFKTDSKYLVSHQPSIWKKSFLLSCLKPGESPWANEYEGTKRLKDDPSIKRKIAIYPCNWYAHKCIKGKVIES